MLVLVMRYYVSPSYEIMLVLVMLVLVMRYYVSPSYEILC